MEDIKSALYEVTYWTPKTDHSSDHSYTDRIEAFSILDAVTKSLDKYVAQGRLVLTGFDTLDSFGGLDRDYYEKGDRTDIEFRVELGNLIHGVKKAHL